MPTLAERVADHAPWYHTIELAPGVTTPGLVDLRPVAPKVLPPDATGLRALDVGTFDGFWAFELERRGAQVVAIDVDSVAAADLPPVNRPRLEAQAAQLEVVVGTGFRIAREALGSQVERVELSVYELEPEAVGGPVDLATIGALLLHLRDPVGALERIRGALRPGGRLTIFEPVDPLLSLLAPRTPLARFAPRTSDFNWWFANVATLRDWLITAGFERPRRLGLHRPPATAGMGGMTYCAYTATRPG